MYTPIWEGVVKGYAINKINLDLWKFNWLGYEFDDLYQEAWLIFYSCKEEYKEIDTPQHFMSLFKTALHNRFYDLSQKSSLDKDNLTDTELEYCYKHSEEHNFFLNLDQASEEVRMVLNLVFNAPSELLEWIGFQKKSSKGFLNNKKMCQLLGIEETDLVGKVKSFLRSSFNSV